MSALYHNGHWYGGGQDIDIQSDPTATSFESGKVPTGDTVQSVLNSKINYETLTLSTDTNGFVELTTMPLSSRIVIGARIQGVVAIPVDAGATNWYLACKNANMEKVTFSNRPNCRVAYITI